MDGITGEGANVLDLLMIDTSTTPVSGISDLLLDNDANGTSSYDLSSSSAPPEVPSCDWFTFTLYVIVLGLLCAFGLVGNTISFIVLRAERHSHVATFLLQTMAVADNLFLITTALSQMSTALTLFQESLVRDNELSTEDFTEQLYYSYTFMAYVKVRLLLVSPLHRTCLKLESLRCMVLAFRGSMADGRRSHE
jgi:hypothetical protein